MEHNLIARHKLALILVSNLLAWCSADSLSATTKPEHLLETRQRVINDLEDYIQKEEGRLRDLKQYLDLYKTEQEKAMEDIPNYLSNPISAYTLIKRLTTDLDYIEERINRTTAYISVRNTTTDEVDNKELADKHEPDNKNERDTNNEPDTKTGPSSKFETGAKNEPDAKSDIDAKKDTSAKDKIDSNDMTQAVKETGNVTETAENGINDEDVRSTTGKNEFLTPEEIKEIETDYIDYRRDMIMYEALCRGEYDVAPAMASRLHCRYLNDKPFLKLAPIKMEQRYIDPDLFLFHDVISDREIEHIKEKAKPEFKRALVFGSNNNDSKPAYYRISQSTWIGDSDSEIVARLTQRVSDFTGLDMAFAESLQVGNYGIGGHYEPHFDWSGVEKPRPRVSDRIATAMFYMSDVTQGGATVFPKLGLTVFPRKGSAVFWMNLHASGEGDLATIHAACPVLEGSKWVSNKWISLWGQEFIKPCNTEHQLQNVLRKTPAPVLKPAALLQKRFRSTSDTWKHQIASMDSAFTETFLVPSSQYL